MTISTEIAAPPDHSGLTRFYRDMTAPERRTFWACFAGWALDAMDFMIYPLVIGTIIALWQVDRGAAGFAVTVTLLFSAVGGWLAGYLSDRIGACACCRSPSCGFRPSRFSALRQSFTS